LASLVTKDGKLVWKLLIALALSASAPAEEVGFLLDTPGEPSLSVRHLPGQGPPVLYVHGATFPAALSVSYRIDGMSWADDLQGRGLDVWSFDFAGYGGSERPGSMMPSSVEHSDVPGRAQDAARQIERVVAHIRQQTQRSRVSIIAHSWGTIPAALFSGTHPDWVDRLVLFGPVAQRNSAASTDAPKSSFTLVTASDQWQSFQSGVPADESSPIGKAEFDRWAEAYLASDPTSGLRTPPSAMVPGGPDADFDDAWHGRLPYDPAAVQAPTMIVRGEWDPITRDADAAWLANAMRNVRGGVRDVKLPRGGHRMHLEQNRQALFDAVGAFLTEQAR